MPNFDPRSPFGWRFMLHRPKIDAKGRRQTIFGRCFEGLWQLGLLAEVGGNLVLEWRGGGLPLSAGMGCADAFTCPCGRPKIDGDRTSVAYSIRTDILIL